MSKQLLEMIENVDPEDTDKLDEIDARVWCWLADKEYAGQDELGNRIYKEREDCFPMVGCGSFANGDLKLFTRSRDALKSIRLDGWVFRIGTDPNLEHMAGFWNTKVKDGWSTDEYPLPTEELAELHAIIQAIAYEGSQCGIK